MSNGAPETLDEALRALGFIAGHEIAAGEPTLCPICGAPNAVAARRNGDGPRPHYEITCQCAEAAVVAVLDYELRRVAGTDSAPGTSPEWQEERLSAIRQMLTEWSRPRRAFPTIRRVIKRGRTGEAYDLELADRRIIELGSASDLLNRGRFRAALYGQADVVLILKPDDHANLAAAIAQVAEVTELPTGDQETAAWIAAYAEANFVQPNVDRAHSAQLWDLLTTAGGPPPFIDTTGRLHVQLDPLRGWLRRMDVERLTRKQLAERLQRLGFADVDVAARHGDQTRHRAYWASPPDWEHTA